MNQANYHPYPLVASHEEPSPPEFFSGALDYQDSQRSNASSVDGFPCPGYYSNNNETTNHYEQARREEDERFYAQFPEARQPFSPDTHAYYVDDHGQLCSVHGNYVPSPLGYDDISSAGNMLSSAHSGYRDDEWTSHAPSAVRESIGGDSSTLSNALAESANEYALHRVYKNHSSNYAPGLAREIEPCGHGEGAYGLNSYSLYHASSTISAADTIGLVDFEASQYHASDSPGEHSPSSLPPLSPGSAGSSSPRPSSQTSKLPIPPLPNSRGRSHRRSNTLPLRRTFGPKPALACYFCRGRKIACGMPPEPDSNGERTCNQCQRRSLKCVFPTEIRRSPRRPKDESEPGSRSKPRRRNTVSGPSTTDAAEAQ